MKTIIDHLLEKGNGYNWRFPAEKKELNMKDLKKKVINYAYYFINKGLQPGDRIGFILDNSSDLVCLLYATWCINAIAIPLRPRSGRYHHHVNYIKNMRFSLSFFLYDRR